MNSTHNILVIGRHQQMMDSVKALLTQHSYNVFTAIKNDEAFYIFDKENIDAIVIGGGVDAESRNLFHTTFSNKKTTVKIVDAHPHTILKDLENIFK